MSHCLRPQRVESGNCPPLESPSHWYSERKQWPVVDNRCSTVTTTTIVVFSLSRTFDVKFHEMVLECSKKLCLLLLLLLPLPAEMGFSCCHVAEVPVSTDRITQRAGCMWCSRQSDDSAYTWSMHQAIAQASLCSICRPCICCFGLRC